MLTHFLSLEDRLLHTERQLQEACDAIATLQHRVQTLEAQLLPALEETPPESTAADSGGSGDSGDSRAATGAIRAIYTDGACSGNPGPGGWAAVVYYQDGTIQELGGADAATTNNRMEMQAAIGALTYLQTQGIQEPVTLYTDSEYVKNGITKWIKGWKKKDWKTTAGKPVLNQDLWETLDALNSSKIDWRYVRGHAGNEGNERCDAIARAFSQGQVPPLASVSERNV